MTIKAQIKWTDGMQFVGHGNEGPAVVLGAEESGGPSPMEMVLMGVAGCTAVDVVTILKKRRANFTNFEISIIGDQAENHPKRYTKIRIEYMVYGRGVKPKDVERAIELSETKFCSAMASVNADIEHTYRIVEEE